MAKNYIVALNTETRNPISPMCISALQAMFVALPFENCFFVYPAWLGHVPKYRLRCPLCRRSIFCNQLLELLNENTNDCFASIFQRRLTSQRLRDLKQGR